jgi:hypothetical protein
MAKAIPFPSKRRLDRVKKYFDRDIKDQNLKIHFIEADGSILPDGNLVEYKLMRKCWRDAKFEYLVIDEAHNIRRVGSAFHSSCLLLQCNTPIMVTGTPIVSTLRDLEAPLHFFWKRYEIDVYAWDSMKIGNCSGLWHHGYDPYAYKNELEDPLVSVHGLLSPELIDKYPGLAKMKGIYEQTGVPIWQMNPFLFKRAGKEMEWGTSFGQQVVRPILGLLSIRRTPRSPVKLPDGKSTYPGVDLLPMQIITEELCFGPGLKKVAKEYGDKMASSLMVPGPSGMKGGQQGDGAYINFAAHRAGILSAHNSRNIMILSNDASHLGKDKADATQTLNQLRDGAGRTQKVAERVRAHAAADTEPTVGVEHVRKIISEDMTGGLQFIYSETRVDPNISGLATPGQWLDWLLPSTPATLRVLELCTQYVIDQSHRVCIFIDTPWIQQ